VTKETPKKSKAGGNKVTKETPNKSKAGGKEKEPSPKSKDALKLPGTSKADPIYYGVSVISTNLDRKYWRAVLDINKPRAGTNVVARSFGASSNPKDSWASLVDAIKAVN